MTRLGRTALAGFGALCKLFALSAVLTLALASAAFAAPGVVNASANLPNSPSSDSWTLTKTYYSSSTTCGGSGTTTTSTLTGTAANSTSTASGTSVKLQASSGSSGGQRSFSQWTSSSGHTFTTINSTTICAQGQNNVTKGYVANYVPKLSVSDVTVTEGDSGTANATFTVSLSATSSQSVTANFATANGTATQPGDYTSNSGTLTFAAGETTKSVTVVVKGDTATEPDETFFVNLSGATNATIVDNQGVGTIANDDYTPQANDDGSLLSPITLTEDDPGGVITNVLSNDTGLGDTPITVQVTTPPNKGTTAVNPDKTITYNPGANQNGADSYVYEVTDSDGQTSTATVYLQITPVNDAPVAQADSYNVDEDQTLTVIAANGVLDNDTDAENNLLTAVKVAGPTHGTLTFDATGSFIYTPEANFNGSDSFTYKANDGALDSNVATVMLTVNGVNDAPVADSQTVSTDEDTSKPVTLSAADADNSGLTYKVTSLPAHGKLYKGNGTENGEINSAELPFALSGDQVTYVPNADYNGPDSFKFLANDGSTNSNEATVSITVDPVNDAPTISDIPNQTINEDADTGNIAFTVGDAETLATLLTATASSSDTTLVPNNDANLILGGLGANRTIKVKPAPNKSGTATITVTAGDGAATTSDTYVLTVNAVNDAPNAVDDTADADEGGPDVTMNVLANDDDVDGDTLTVANNTQPPAGEGGVTCSNTNCTYTPSANFHGTTGFDYTISDGNGGTDTATVTVDVAATNDAPTADDDTFSIDEDETLTVGAPGILDNDSDVDDLLGPLTTLTAVLVDGPDDGTLDFDGDGSFTYTPEANFNGSDSFTYRANDGTISGNLATVAIDVSPVNDAPGFDLPADPDQTVSEDAGAQTVGGFVTNVSPGPADESSQNVSFAVTDDNDALFSGRPEISPNGTLTYTPEPDASGTATVTARATDDGGTGLGGDDTSAPQTFTITVSAVNDVPTVSLDGTANADEGQTKTYSFTAADPDPGGFTVGGGFPDCGAGGSFVAGSLDTTATGGDFRCRFPDGPASPSVRVQVTDTQGADSNIATRAVTVANVAPSISLGGPATAEEGDTKTYSFAVTDPGEDTHSVSSACGANGVKVTGSDDYDASTKEGGFRCRFPNGPATSNVTTGVNDSDGAADSDNRVVLVTIDNVAPVAHGDGPYATDEDEPLSVGAPGVLGNDDDAGAGDVLGVELAQGPDHGTVALGPDGSFTYTPQADYNGPDSFTYEACDDAPAPLCDVGTASITVTAIEDGPSLSGIADRTTDEGTPTGDIAFTVGDVDTAAGNLMVTGSSSNTTLVPNGNVVLGGSGANRTVTVTPTADRSGTTEITLTVSDGSLEATKAFLLTVRDVTAPDTILDSAPPDFTRNKDANFSFSSEAGAIFECSLDGAAFQPCDSPEDYPNLAQGEHTFRARATDAGGNTDASPVSHTWIVDSVAPAGTVSVNGGALYTNRARVVLALGMSDPSPSSGFASMRFSDSQTAWSSWEPYATKKRWTLGAGNGKKTIFVQYKDLAGNQASARTTITLDSVAPKVTKVTPLDGARTSASASVTASFSEAINPATLDKRTVKLFKAGTTKPVPATISYNPAARKVTLIPTQNLLPGATYTVTVTGGAKGVKDLAGNALAATEVWQFNVR